MKLFKRQIKFDAVDPLGDGLREAILAEQLEPQAIVLEESLDADELYDYWNSVQG